MNNLNVIAVDLAKLVFQVCVLNNKNKMLSNGKMRAKRFGTYLAKQPRSLVAFEACGRSQHWARKAQEYGHDVLILPARIVAAFRQGHKTDVTDALAIGLCARQPAIKPTGIKSIEQQSVQSDLRVHKHISDQLTATGNMLRGLLAEFGIEIPKSLASLKKHMPMILEDGENGLPLSVRESLFQAWALWQEHDAHLKVLEQLLARRVQEHEPCQRLSKLEGVGPKNALGLYAELGNARHYKNGRNAAACVGVTPKQHSSGGQTRIGSIGKCSGNHRLRASLILGAHSVINTLDKREARTEKERWLKDLIIRRGKGRAAVALANKTVRTAWAMLYHNVPYKGSIALSV